MSRGLRSLAAAGNALALVLLVLVLARQDVLLGNGAAAPLPVIQAAATPAPASRVLVVVIDALRADRVDGMPHLAALARTGGRGTARVEALVPSTVSGIRALVEGTPPPPASFTDDFGATRAPHGGIFAALAATGPSPPGRASGPTSTAPGCLERWRWRPSAATTGGSCAPLSERYAVTT